jgi:hypothetical protein
MRIRQKYIERLRQSTEEDLRFDQFEIIKKNIHYLNPKFKEKLIEDVTQIDFNTLYPNLLISLFDEGLIDEKWRGGIDGVRWFLKNRKDLKLLSLSGSTEYEKWKTHCNSLYMEIKSMHVTNYMDLFYTDLIEKYSDKVIYIDVDRLILNISKSDFQSKTHIEELYDFDFEASFIRYSYIEGLKRYLFQEENGDILIKGFKESKKIDVLSLVKRLIRESKLENLGI